MPTEALPSVETSVRAAVQKGVWGEFDLQKQMDRELLADYTPPCIAVNKELEIIQFRGYSGTYFDAKPGAASLRLVMKSDAARDYSTSLRRGE